MFHPGDLAPRRDGHAQDNARNTPRERYQRLLGRPADGGGTAALLTGPLYKRSAPARLLQWYDISGDGRYTEQRTGNIDVRPATPDDLTRHFTTWIASAVEHLRHDDY